MNEEDKKKYLRSNLRLHWVLKPMLFNSAIYLNRIIKTLFKQKEIKDDRLKRIEEEIYKEIGDTSSLIKLFKPFIESFVLIANNDVMYFYMFIRILERCKDIKLTEKEQKWVDEQKPAYEKERNILDKKENIGDAQGWTDEVYNE